ncbi:unnamed protein product [Trichobilharzia regenti]|nr:unnamed protein product [Trichobilharzia regenti]
MNVNLKSPAYSMQMVRLSAFVTFFFKEVHLRLYLAF